MFIVLIIQFLIGNCCGAIFFSCACAGLDENFIYCMTGRYAEIPKLFIKANDDLLIWKQELLHIPVRSYFLLFEARRIDIQKRKEPHDPSFMLHFPPWTYYGPLLSGYDLHNTSFVNHTYLHIFLILGEYYLE